MTFEEIKKLVSDFGDACEQFGDYNSERNAKTAREYEDKLLDAIKKLYNEK